MHTFVDVAPPFTQPAKDKINDSINRLVELYTKCVTQGDKAAAHQQLRLHQRENIAWERDTVWRQMIGRERRGEGGMEDTAGATLVHEPEPTIVDIPTPIGIFTITRGRIFRVAAIAIFILLLNIQVVPGQEANRCFAILSFCTVLWATEASFSYLLNQNPPPTHLSLGYPSICDIYVGPFVPGHIPCHSRWRRCPDAPTRGDEACSLSIHFIFQLANVCSRYVFSIMFSPTIMLLIGGFTISSALSKTNIDRVLITRVLSLAGTRPSTVLLTFMGVSCFASMWIRFVPFPRSYFSSSPFFHFPKLTYYPL